MRLSKIKCLILFLGLSFIFWHSKPAFAFNVGDTADVTLPACMTSMVSAGTTHTYDYDPATYGGSEVFRDPADTTNILYYYTGYALWIVGIDSISNNLFWDTALSLIPADPSNPSGVGRYYQQSAQDSCDGTEVGTVLYHPVGGTPTSSSTQPVTDTHFILIAGYFIFFSAFVFVVYLFKKRI